MVLSIIVAAAENNVIGRDNGLIWRLSADLKRFKALTTVLSSMFFPLRVSSREAYDIDGTEDVRVDRSGIA